jgi:hypothetical protein
MALTAIVKVTDPVKGSSVYFKKNKNGTPTEIGFEMDAITNSIVDKDRKIKLEAFVEKMNSMSKESGWQSYTPKSEKNVCIECDYLYTASVTSLERFTFNQIIQD